MKIWWKECCICQQGLAVNLYTLRMWRKYFSSVDDVFRLKPIELEEYLSFRDTCNMFTADASLSVTTIASQTIRTACGNVITPKCLAVTCSDKGLLLLLGRATVDLSLANTGWMVVWELNAEGLGLHWQKTTVLGDLRAVPRLNYTLTFVFNWREACGTSEAGCIRQQSLRQFGRFRSSPHWPA
jgi:hypothetical protein